MSKAETYLLVLWLIANLLLGAFTVHEYGMSVDETNNQRYATDTLDAYPSLFGIFYEPNYDSSYEGHGPAFITIAAIFVQVVQILFPNVYIPDLWHYSYFMTFQLACMCLYVLTRRWFNVWTAWGLLVLFGTQPLLLGHAFINPKDIPFLCFLTLSVLLGFRMVDAVSDGPAYVSLKTPVQILVHRFRNTDPRRRMKFLIYLSLAVIAILALVLFSRQVNLLLGDFVTAFYNAQPDTWAGQLFRSIASPSVSAQDYVTKAIKVFDRLERGLLIACLLFFLAYFGLLISNKSLSSFLKDTWTEQNSLGIWTRRLAGSLRNSVDRDSIKNWFAVMFRALRNPALIFAGIALGLATGVRAIGPVAGLIVVLYLFAKAGSKAWTTAIAYFLIAGIVTYIAWPHLWNAPIQRYLEALGIASNFTHFPGRVFFNGRMYGPSELPRSYLPVLFSIQLTEPLILSIYLGLGILLWRLLRDRVRTDLLLFIGLGFVFPLFGLILLRSPLYHNFRQVLFVLPAMALLAALVFQPLFDAIARTWVRILLIVALALPGVYSTVKLYPYEYVYYNSLVGGPAGATYRYELDYWRISLREMALELNKVASPGAIVVVTRSAGLLARYTRPDLVIDKPINSILDLEHGYDYIVQVTRGKGGELYPEVNDLIVVERDGTVLATAKEVKDVSGK